MSVAEDYADRDFETVRKALPFVHGRTACVQAGSCLGTYPRFLAQEFDAVYAFEPDPKLFIRSVHATKATNIRWFNAALGRERNLVGTSSTRRDGSHRPTHEGLTHVSGVGITPTLRIDDLNLPT